jgi:WD40 repeat protein
VHTLAVRELDQKYALSPRGHERRAPGRGASEEGGLHARGSGLSSTVTSPMSPLASISGVVSNARSGVATEKERPRGQLAADACSSPRSRPAALESDLHELSPAVSPAQLASQSPPSVPSPLSATSGTPTDWSPRGRPTYSTHSRRNEPDHPALFGAALSPPSPSQLHLKLWRDDMDHSHATSAWGDLLAGAEADVSDDDLLHLAGSDLGGSSPNAVDDVDDAAEDSAVAHEERRVSDAANDAVRRAAARGLSSAHAAASAGQASAGRASPRPPSRGPLARRSPGSPPSGAVAGIEVVNAGPPPRMAELHAPSSPPSRARASMMEEKDLISAHRPDLRASPPPLKTQARRVGDDVTAPQHTRHPPPPLRPSSSSPLLPRQRHSGEPLIDRPARTTRTARELSPRRFAPATQRARGSSPRRAWSPAPSSQWLLPPPPHLRPAASPRAASPSRRTWAAEIGLRTTRDGTAAAAEKVRGSREQAVYALVGGVGGFVACAGRDAVLRMLHPYNGSCAARMLGHKRRVLSLARVSDGTLASGGADFLIKLWRPTEGDCLCTLRGHRDAVTALVSHRGLLVSGSEDQHVKLWNLRSGTCAGTLWQAANDWSQQRALRAAVANSVHSLAVCARDQLAVGVWSGTVRLWDLHRSRCTASFEAHGGTVWAMVQSSQRQLCTTGSDGAVQMWDPRGSCRRPVGTLGSPTTGGALYAMVERRGLLLTGGYDQSIKIWDHRVMRCLGELHGHSGAVRSLAFLDATGQQQAPPAGTLLSSSTDGTVRAWSMQQQQQHHQHHPHEHQLPTGSDELEAVTAAAGDDGRGPGAIARGGAAGESGPWRAQSVWGSWSPEEW